jgi:hypothetical protein
VFIIEKGKLRLIPVGFPTPAYRLLTGVKFRLDFCPFWSKIIV